MPSKYSRTNEAIKALGSGPMTDPAVLAWALARVVDQAAWQVRTARWGVVIYPRKGPEPDLE